MIALGSDIDGIPQSSQKPGVAYHDPIVEGAPEGKLRQMLAYGARLVRIKNFGASPGVKLQFPSSGASCEKLRTSMGWASRTVSVNKATQPSTLPAHENALAMSGTPV